MYKVYMHVVPNGKVYIGITKVSVKARWNGGRGYKNQLFGRAVEKYGWDNIEHIVLFDDIEDEDTALLIEEDLIIRFDSTNPQKGYNVIRSDGHKGRIYSEMFQGKKNPRYGAKLTKEHREALSRANTGSGNVNAKAVRCVNTGEVFETQTMAGKKYNINPDMIGLCARKATKNGVRVLSAGKLDGEKLTWEYVEKGDIIGKETQVTYNSRGSK